MVWYEGIPGLSWLAGESSVSGKVAQVPRSAGSGRMLLGNLRSQYFGQNSHTPGLHLFLIVLRAVLELLGHLAVTDGRPWKCPIRLNCYLHFGEKCTRTYMGPVSWNNHRGTHFHSHVPTLAFSLRQWDGVVATPSEGAMLGSPWAIHHCLWDGYYARRMRVVESRSAILLGDAMFLCPGVSTQERFPLAPPHL